MMRSSTQNEALSPKNNYPKLHNAAWPGMVGKGPDSEACIPLETMVQLTANAQVNGIGFDGMDITLHLPHFDIDGGPDALDRLVDLFQSHELAIGSLVAPIWKETGGGSAMGSAKERQRFLDQVEKTCALGQAIRERGLRPYGVVRIDSADNPTNWNTDPVTHTQLIADTFGKAAEIGAQYGERIAAEGEICWAGMHGWKTMTELFEQIDHPNIGFQADMAHTLLYLLGYNKDDERILPKNFDWNDRATLEKGLQSVSAALRPFTIDFHVAQNDGTVFGAGSHDKTGKHCLATDPNGKLNIAADAAYWLRDANGKLTKNFKHICWDGCMFPNETLLQPQTWNDILAAMIQVRARHGWLV